MNYEQHPKNENLIIKKTYGFALDIIKLYKYLVNEKKEFILSKQMLRAGTSIGANVNEAISGQSKRDFIHKLSIALKEARETSYWLNLLKDSEFINQQIFVELDNRCQEIIKILSSIILTTKERYFSTGTQTNS
ncbi:MAG TPA: four helix bundle protein [Chitinophagaceae bacterium]|jgi:four helix bundle protein